MLRKVRTSPHTSSKLSSWKGKQNLSALLKLFEHIFILIWSEEKPEYTSTEVAEREVLSQIFPKSTVRYCRILEVFTQDGWARPCTCRAPGCLGAHISSPQMPCKRLCLCRTLGLGLGSWGHLALSQMGFHMQHFTHRSAHFSQLLLLGSRRCDLDCCSGWHPQPDCSTASFHPFASQEVIYLSQEI